MKKSSFALLLTHPKPADKQTAIVAFSKGDVFEATFSEERPKRRITMDAPPKMPERPEYAKDYTGLRQGRITAVFWFRQTKDERSSVWVVRCDCGKYEFRKRLGRWTTSPNTNDTCKICERECEMQAGGNAKKTHPERTMRWVDKMRRMGLTDAEIITIRQLNTISTQGKTAEEIRTDIKQGLNATC